MMRKTWSERSGEIKELYISEKKTLDILKVNDLSCKFKPHLGITWKHTWQSLMQTQTIGAFHLVTKNVQYLLSFTPFDAAVMVQFFVFFQ